MLRNVLLVCALVLSALLGSYGFITPEPPADFRYVNPSGIHTLDPARMSWTNDFRIALNIWEGLTSWDPRTMEPIGGAAEFPPVVSADGRTYTFTIRPDARWSNGEAVTTADFVRGWRRGLEPGTATDYTFLLTDRVAGAEQYVQWRRGVVPVLTALARLRDGWGVDRQQLTALCEDRTCTEYGDLMEHALGALCDLSGALSSGERPSESELDFGRLHEEVFEAHAAQLDERFAAVGVSAQGDRTFVVTLREPCPYFLDLTGFPIFLPIHVSIERLRHRHRDAPITEEGLVVYDPQWTKPDYREEGYSGLITNGPYVLSEWRFKRRARLGVNPHHRLADRLACRTVDMLVYDNVSAAIMAYEAGDVDFLPDMSVPYGHEIARLAKSGERPDFHLVDVAATYFLNFNCASSTVLDRPNPFVDARVRRAFALALDRERIVNSVLQRGDRVAHSFVPPNTMSCRTGCSERQEAGGGRHGAGGAECYEPPAGVGWDPAEARALLARAGYPAGKGLPRIDLLYTPNDERVAQAVARMWEDQLGARVDLRCKETKTFAEDKANHRYMVARGNWYADYNDPTTFLDCLTTGNGNNDSGYANPVYDGLLAAARLEPDPSARADLLRRAEAIAVSEDLPILPILHYALPLGIKPYVQGLEPNPRLWFPFRYLSVVRSPLSVDYGSPVAGNGRRTKDHEPRTTDLKPRSTVRLPGEHDR